jgi:hypothetical protein
VAEHPEGVEWLSAPSVGTDLTQPQAIDDPQRARAHELLDRLFGGKKLAEIELHELLAIISARQRQPSVNAS